jgi:uncharacterized DUF497 family protein
MNASYELSGQVFEWDEDKARKNLDEHRVTFRIAATVFMDHCSVQFPDDEHSEEELREVLIGICSDGRMLRVSFTERPPNIRLFSARLANHYDESRYTNGY